MSDPGTFEFLPAIDPGDHAWDAESGGPRGRCFAFAGSDMIILGATIESPQVPTWDDLRAWDIS
ncbi:MAG TPA: hypothetical protein VHG52_00360, partial [Thermomicrobiales bacterium]|nr:hypothetical protein [Thermomicrobiales bacterium]